MDLAVKMDTIQSRYIEQYMIIGLTSTMTYHMDLFKEFIHPMICSTCFY